MTRRAHLAIALALALSIGLPGCGTTSAPARFHSLLAAAGATTPATRPAPALRVEVLAVTLPVQVDVPQIVVRLPDDSLTALEQERWIAPLADEIRAALALRIEAALADAAAGANADAPWRVQLELQRFDSVLGGVASMQGLWSLQPPGRGVVLRCQVQDRQAVAIGPAALVEGHRAMLQRLGDAIGRAVRAAAAGQAPACG